MNVESLLLAQVEVGTRLRVVDPDKVRELAVSMREVGQLAPVIVTPIEPAGQFRLVAGAHRLAAVEEAGFERILATVIEGGDDELRLAEIDENLYRHELNPLDQATFLAERKGIYERLHPESRRGGDRRSADLTANFAVWSKSFAADTAERLGLGERTVRLAIRRHMELSPEARAAIAGTSIAKTGADLDALAKVPRERQLQVATWVLDQRRFGRKAGVADARITVLDERAAPRPDAGFNALLGAWRKANGSDRGRFMRWLSDNEREIFDPLLQAREDELAADAEPPTTAANSDGLASASRARGAA